MIKKSIALLLCSCIITVSFPLQVMVNAATNTLVSATECENMTKGGSYAGNIATPFSGVVLYGNGDYCTTNSNFPVNNEAYEISVTGASTNSSVANVSVYVNDIKAGSLSFSGTTPSVQSVHFNLTTGSGSLPVKFLLESDTGANDTLLDKYEIYDIGAIPPLPTAPVPPSVGAAVSGNYRNIFKELGKTDVDINKKLNDAWTQLFYGDNSTQRIFYPVGTDKGYIYSADSNDVRSEGMSYGMMMCVQMNKQDEFNRLWTWAKTNMYQSSGQFKGMFAWQCKTDGTTLDTTPASDGEEYFATSLLFASARWGDGTGIYNYKSEGQAVLDAMLHQKDDGEGVNIFDTTKKMPVFCPIGNAATFSDPSYHLPAFYEVWAKAANKDNQFWSDSAAASRSFFKNATNSTTGLAPDYANFDGTPKNDNGHGDYRFDAWRTASNIAVDYAWWAKDSWEETFADRIQAFFAGKGIDSYANQWKIDGTQALSTDHSTGTVAMNAVASLAATKSNTWDFVNKLWDSKIPDGTYRYYDGCLYMMGLLHCSGNFKAYLPTSTTTNNSSITPTTASFDKNTTKRADVIVNTTLNGNVLNGIKNGTTSLVFGTDYTVSGNTIAISKSYLEKQSTGTQVLTFDFSAGVDPTISITVSNTTAGTVNNSSITPTTASFDKNTTKQADVIVNTTLNGNVLNGIKNGTTSLVSGTDYTVSGNSIVILKSYLAKQSTGTQVLTFDFSAGIDPTISITVSNTTAGGTISAFSQIEAENYSSQSGTSNVSADSGTVVSYSNNSAWTAYNVDFGTSGASSAQLRASDSSYGANVNLYLDSPTGTNFATLYPNGGSAWATVSNSCYPKPTGVHTIYIKNTTSTVNINWLKFVQ